MGIGGSESYLLTVAEHLDRLGHDVTLYTHEPGAGARLARERGIEVVDESGALPEGEAVLAQDRAVSYELASRLPDAPQVFVAHSESFDPQLPPLLDDVVGAAVALNDRVAERLRALDVDTEVVRLRQPIDTERLRSLGPLPERPRRALLLSNNRVADRLSMLEAACRDAGVDLVRMGGSAGQLDDPAPAFAAADIVIGYGRTILEAMAYGRAAYVYDLGGGSGWVTADSYPGIEADGIAGRDETVLDAERLREGLSGYEASMGPVNRDIVTAHHRANVHAQELAGLLRSLSPPARRPRSQLEEMARLVRLEWRARVDAHGLRAENDNLREQLESVRRESERAMLETTRFTEERIQAYESSTSWRLTRPLRAPGEFLRRRRGR